MRLPIYRRLDEGLKIFGLSLKEVAMLGVIFIGVGYLLSFWKWGRLLSLVLSIAAFIAIRIVNRRFEAHFIDKFFRFASLPKGLGRSVFKTLNQEQKYHEDLFQDQK